MSYRILDPSYVPSVVDDLQPGEVPAPPGETRPTASVNLLPETCERDAGEPCRHPEWRDAEYQLADAALTESEIAVLELLAEATNAFASLPEHHPTDLREWAHEVHQLQYRVLKRVAVRMHPDLCTPMQPSGGLD